MSDVLVISPHPDDEVLGCGGSIVNHRAAGREVHILYLTSGEQGCPGGGPDVCRTVREREAVSAAAALGVPAADLRWLRLPDGAIDARDLANVGCLVQVLRELRPRLLYVPHPDESSYDHRDAYQLCDRAAGLAGSRNHPEWGTNPHWVPAILGYEVWTPITAPQYTEDITTVIDRKIAALACYQSQTAAGKGPRQADYIGESARHLPGYRGAMTTGGYREAFTVLRLGRLNP